MRKKFIAVCLCVAILTVSKTLMAFAAADIDALKPFRDKLEEINRELGTN